MNRLKPMVLDCLERGSSKIKTFLLVAQANRRKVISLDLKLHKGTVTTPYAPFFPSGLSLCVGGSIIDLQFAESPFFGCVRALRNILLHLSINFVPGSLLKFLRRNNVILS